MISDGDIIDGMSMSYNEEDGFVAIDVSNHLTHSHISLLLLIGYQQ